jgi:hypothetical protein
LTILAFLVTAIAAELQDNAWTVHLSFSPDTENAIEQACDDALLSLPLRGEVRPDDLRNPVVEIHIDAGDCLDDAVDMRVRTSGIIVATEGDR